MEKLVINSYEEFESYLGKDLGTSEWLEIDQDRINKFADATGLEESGGRTVVCLIQAAA